MDLVTEYLVIIEKANANALYTLCDTPQEFKKLLQKESDIVIKGNNLIYKNILQCSFNIHTDKIKGKEQRFFYVVISFSGEEEKIEQYTETLRTFRVVINKAGGQLETLNNDVSAYYSNKSYPLIHKLENLMRKLITYFMLTQVGKEWIIEASPKDIKEAIDKGKRPQQYGDALHQVDFIHLGDFLFKAYQTKNVSDLYKLFDSATKIEELNLDNLREYKAKSNWEKYFSKIVDCTDVFLKTRWDELYQLRCKVAHNAIINKADYERIEQLVEEVFEKLQNAINNIGKVQVPEADKETIVENVVSNINSLLGEFINYWKLFEVALNKFAFDYDFIEEYMDSPSTRSQIIKSPRRILTEMRNSKLIPANVFENAITVYEFRNRLLHSANFAFNEQEILSWINILKDLLGFFEAPINTDSWKAEVVNALESCGGEAHLIDIYTYIKENSSRTLPETWKSTIRNTLQRYSSDTKAYAGGEDLFEHVDIGRWGLKNFKASSS